MLMVVVGDSSLQQYSPSRVAWSEGRWPLGAGLHSSSEPSKLSQWPCGHDNNTINIALGIIIIILITVNAYILINNSYCLTLLVGWQERDLACKKSCIGNPQKFLFVKTFGDMD